MENFHFVECQIKRLFEVEYNSLIPIASFIKIKDTLSKCVISNFVRNIFFKTQTSFN